MGPEGFWILAEELVSADCFRVLVMGFSEMLRVFMAAMMSSICRV